MKKTSLLLIVFLVLFSCKKDITPLTFKDETIEKNENAIIAVNYPKAEGEDSISKRINETIENFLANEINMSEKPDKNLKLKQALNDFDKEFKSFKQDFSDSTQQWEILIESEIAYDSEHLLCVAVNSYLDTGGAHGNSHITFLNFDKKTGKLLNQKELIKDIEGFKKLVQPYFIKATKPLADDAKIEDPFYGEGFQLPENIGFENNRMVLLYNVYEIASYAQGVTEFSVPFEEVEPFLNLEL